MDRSSISSDLADVLNPELVSQPQETKQPDDILQETLNILHNLFTQRNTADNTSADYFETLNSTVFPLIPPDISPQDSAKYSAGPEDQKLFTNFADAISSILDEQNSINDYLKSLQDYSSDTVSTLSTSEYDFDLSMPHTFVSMTITLQEPFIYYACNFIGC